MELSTGFTFLLLLGLIYIADGQFKTVDSSHFRTKKGVSTNSSAVSFVQINHYMDGIGDSRSFDPNVIKVHIQYKKNNDFQSQDNKPASTLIRRIITNHKNRPKYNPSVLHKYKSTSKGKKHPIGNPVQRALIINENQRILKKLKIQPKKKHQRKGSYKSNCKCVRVGNNCTKIQVSVGRCTSNEVLCCL